MGLYTDSMAKEIVVIAHNVRSTHNIGSILRTCDGLGVSKLYISGYSPYPLADNDVRLPHISKKLSQQINKTALGAEKSVVWEHISTCQDVIPSYKEKGYEILALEQLSTSTALPSFEPTDKSILILGEEVNGISNDVLSLCDRILEIPMYGEKESYNVSVATAIALYHLRFFG